MRKIFLLLAFVLFAFSSCSILNIEKSRYSHVKKVKIDEPINYALHDIDKMNSREYEVIENVELPVIANYKPINSGLLEKTPIVAKKQQAKSMKNDDHWSFPPLKQKALARSMDSESGSQSNSLLLTVLLIVLIIILLSILLPGIIAELLGIAIVVLLVLLILYLAGSI